MLAYRYEFAVSVEFSRSSRCHSYAQQHRLLQDKNQHSRQNGISVTSCRIEYRNLIKGERLGGNLVVSICKSSCLCYLDARVDVAGYGLRGLINRLIGQHQTHIAVNAHMRLFAPVQFRIEVGREVKDSVNRLSAHQFLRLVQTVAVIGSLSIWRSIIIADKLA